MTNRLKPIILQKQQEVDLLLRLIKEDASHPIRELLLGNDLLIKKPSNFKQALRASFLTIIAEIKRKSPSKGILASIPDPLLLTQSYLKGGANALSILTDQQFFGGHINDLIKVAQVYNQSIPILRKDFIIDKVQIAEAAIAGASAVLLIVSVLGKKLRTMLEFAHSINLDVLVEVHNKEELSLALDAGADIVGINNRNLSTFEVNIDRAIQLMSDIPKHIIKVAESGISTPALARNYYELGFDSVLIGEALVKSENPELFIQECRHG